MIIFYLLHTTFFSEAKLVGPNNDGKKQLSMFAVKDEDDSFNLFDYEVPKTTTDKKKFIRRRIQANKNAKDSWIESEESNIDRDLIW